MEHIAIDLGGKESQICIRGENGDIKDEFRIDTLQIGDWLSTQPVSRVIVETCAESFAIADQAIAGGHEVRVVPATLVRSLGVGSRRIKTDQRDAQILSKVSTHIDLPSVHIPSALAREWKTICGMREALVAMRTQGINTVRGWLRTQGIRVPSGGSETFPGRVRTVLINHPVGIADYIERQLVVLETLSKQIAAADREMTSIANRDAVCQRLMTVPGVGPLTAMRFKAAVDEIERFKDAHQLESYLGLTPGEHSSGERCHRLGITKAGPRQARWLLGQAAWNIRRFHRGSPLWEWQQAIERRRGPKIAVIATARKLAGILYILWRKGTTYDPCRAAVRNA